VIKKDQLVLGLDALECLHATNCLSNDSREILMKNIVFCGTTPAEFDAYCFECGAFLYHYSHGVCEV
jgi:hypothetical protein